MTKLTLASLTSSYRSNAALNANFDAIEAAIENTLSRDGTAPNAMSANLDMGSNRVVNLDAPVDDNDAIRKVDVDSGIGPDITTVADNITSVTTVATNISDVTTVSADLTGADTIGDASDLLAITAPGIVAKDTGGSPVSRTITGSTGISVTNGDGGAGNPTISLDAELVDISGITPVDGTFIVGDGADFVGETGDTALTSLGGGTTGIAVFKESSAGAIRTTLSLVPGSDVLAYDANLQAFVDAFTAPTSDGVAGQYLKTDGAGALTFGTPAGGGDTLAAANESITGTWDFSSGGATFGDATFSVVDTSSPTKRAAFDVSGVSAGVTRTLSLEDRSGTLTAKINSDSDFASEVAGAAAVDGMSVAAGTYTTDISALSYGSSLVEWSIDPAATFSSGQRYPRLTVRSATNGSAKNLNAKTSSGLQLEGYSIVGDVTGAGKYFAFRSDLTCDNTTTDAEAGRCFIGRVTGEGTGEYKCARFGATDNGAGAASIAGVSLDVRPVAGTTAAYIAQLSEQAAGGVNDKVEAIHVDSLNGNRLKNGLVFEQGLEVDDAFLQASITTAGSPNGRFLKLKDGGAGVIFEVDNAGRVLSSDSLHAGSFTNGVKVTDSTVSRTAAAGTMKVEAGANSGTTLTLAGGGSDQLVVSDDGVSMIGSARNGSGTFSATTLYGSTSLIAGTASNGITLGAGGDISRTAAGGNLVISAGTNTGTLFQLKAGNTTQIELSNDGVKLGAAARQGSGTLAAQGLYSTGIVDATTGFQVGGTQVVGSQGGAITSLTDNTGVTHDDTIANASLTDSSGGTADGTVAAVSGSGADANINNNFAECVASINALEANDADIAAKLEEVLAALRTHGLIAT